METSLNRILSITAIACALTLVAGCATQTKTKETKPAAAATTNAPAAAVKAAVPSKPTVIRIKAGASAPFKDAAGNTWEAERGFEGGSTIDRDASSQVANTKDAGLYLSEHYSMDSFSTKLANGKYMVKLHFAETYEGVSGAGQRVFSFKVQGKEFKDFDVFVKAGGAYKAYVESVPVEVTTGELKVTFTAQTENPEINAIEIIPQ
jgi:hypothetical protein